MADLQTFKDFDIPNANVTLWIFKKSAQEGQIVFKGRWIDTSDELDAALKEAVVAARERITEFEEYSLLGQTNEGSALTITTLETHAGLIVNQAAEETDQEKIVILKHIRNADFYVIKLVVEDFVLHAVRKADSNWSTRKARRLINAVFADERLALEEDVGFQISRDVDFFIFADDIIISRKAQFESVLSYKAAHEDDFLELIAEPEFAAVFSDVAAIVEFVGENKMHLRRAAAIRQKAHYKNANFVANLRAHHQHVGLQLMFDNDGKIVPSLDSCRDIFQALLDHRLTSAFSNNVYDVASSVVV